MSIGIESIFNHLILAEMTKYHRINNRASDLTLTLVTLSHNRLARARYIWLMDGFNKHVTLHKYADSIQHTIKKDLDSVQVLWCIHSNQSVKMHTAP